MMMSEFIERTGFEPTAEEYRQIEDEYMGCDVDKDKFCKDWKKNGGVQRCMRLRARRIEELENQLRKADKSSDQLNKEWEAKYDKMFKQKAERIAELTKKLEKAEDRYIELTESICECREELAEEKAKMEIVRKAMKILRGDE